MHRNSPNYPSSDYLRAQRKQPPSLRASYPSQQSRARNRARPAAAYTIRERQGRVCREKRVLAVRVSRSIRLGGHKSGQISLGDTRTKVSASGLPGPARSAYPSRKLSPCGAAEPSRSQATEKDFPLCRPAGHADHSRSFWGSLCLPPRKCLHKEGHDRPRFVSFFGVLSCRTVLL